MVDSGASLAHDEQKKDLSSDGIGYFAKIQELTVLLTANGEVHTEAQENVHDLNLFVTLQFLEETLAVLSLGKLGEKHGYSYEWFSGQEPRLTNEEKTIMCKIDLGLPTSSGSNSSSTSTLQDSSSTSPPRAK